MKVVRAFRTLSDNRKTY